MRLFIASILTFPVYMYTDLKQYDKLGEDVFDGNVLDYSAMFGTEPYTISVIE